MTYDDLMTTEEDFEYGEYDLEQDVTPVEKQDALPYPAVSSHDSEYGKPLGFTSAAGVTPSQAIARARAGVLNNTFWGVGQCLRTVRGYYGVDSKYETAAESWEAAEHKHYAKSGTDVPRGAPVWWTGGSDGAGHVAISIGGGLCISTDWKEQGRSAYARIDDITELWGLDFKGWTREVNDVVVWRPSQPVGTVALANLKPGKRNKDVLALKKRMKEKGYGGFIVSSEKYGGGIQRAYKKYQNRLGFTGPNADGIPGVLSLKKLGFRVK